MLTVSDVIGRLKSPVFVHADLTPIHETTWLDAAERLAKTLEPYDLIVPAFTYSFRHKKVFDVERSPCEDVGMFPEYMRTVLPCRTMHGIFSCSTSRSVVVGYDSFGDDSIFDYLWKRDGSILFVGCGFSTCTFIHYIEQMEGVDYRHITQMTGVVRDEAQETICTFTKNDRNAGVKTDLSYIETQLLLSGTLWQETPHVMYGHAREIYREVAAELQVDPYCLVEFEEETA